MAYQRIKDFWINKINDLINAHNVQPDEVDWQDQINNVKVWTDFKPIGLRICQNIYTKANQAVPADADISGNNYGTLCGNTFTDLGLEYETVVDDLDAHKALYGELLTALAYVPTANDDSDPTNLWADLKNDLAGKTLDEAIQQAQELQNRENQIKQAIDLPTGANIPNDWHTQDRTSYDKLRTLINGTPTGTLPVNWESQVLVNHSCPTAAPCSQTHCPNSHTDYNSIKQERDTLKTENTQLKEHQCDCDSKVAAKEKEIITKIITDCSLSTERERENVLEAVITEIKSKIIPPTDNAKDQKITELETEITKLKTGKPQNEIVEKMTEFSKQLNLSESQISELKKADSYQELFTSQSKMVEKKLNSEVQEKNHAQTLNYVLGALSLGSLLLLAWVLIKRNSLTPEIGGKKEKD